MSTKHSRSAHAEAGKSLYESGEAAMRAKDELAPFFFCAAESCFKEADDYASAAKARGMLTAIRQLK